MLFIKLLLVVATVNAFQTSLNLKQHVQPSLSMKNNLNNDNIQDRRSILQKSILSTLSFTSLISGSPSASFAEENYSPGFVQSYDDFIKVDGGAWQYKDVTVGPMSNVQVEPGDRVVYDWSGYTIGYFGRPFQAKGGPTGGAFDKDLDYSRTVIGSHKVVGALEEAFLTMKPGGVRQVIVPYGPLSYPESDLTHDLVGPKPSTFSGQRALNFVLENPRVDRTMLFNIKLIRVDKKDGNGGFKRGDAAR